MSQMINMFADLRYWQLSILFQSILLEGGYLFLQSSWIRKRIPDATPLRMRQFLLYTGGLIIFDLAFASPIDFVSDHDLFSVHMIQHLLEMMVMTPLLLAGIPDWMLSRICAWLKLGRKAFHPVLTLIIFNCVFFTFHIPAIYDESLANEGFHFFEHILFFISSFFLWMPVLSPLPAIPRLKPGALLLYAFFAVNFAMPGEVLLVLAQHPLYSYHPGGALQFGLTPVSDQQLGFLFMIGGMLIPFFLVGIYAFIKYDNRSFYT